MAILPPQGLLTGVRVLDIASVLAAPFATSLLGDYGADVIKVEQPGVGDSMRNLGPFYQGTSLWFTVTSRNKKSVTLDMRKAKGQEVIKELVGISDVVAENFRPGTLEEWNLGYEVFKKVNPRIVMLSISGYGQTGPYREKAGFGMTCQAFSGLTYISGYPDKPPLNPAFSLADYVSGVFGAFSIMTALYHRDALGGKVGQQIDLGLYEAIFRMMEFLPAEYQKLGRVRERTGHPGGAMPVNIYETSDARWMALTCSTDRVFVRLAQAMGKPELAKDPRFDTNPRRVENGEAINSIVAKWVRDRTFQQAQQELDEAGVPISLVCSIADIFENPQYKARENIIEVEDPVIGPVKMPGVVPKFSQNPGRVISTAPILGQHNDEIYGRLLGYSQEQIALLKAGGVI
jgi:formyl-CoA transferase